MYNVLLKYRLRLNDTEHSRIDELRKEYEKEFEYEKNSNTPIDDDQVLMGTDNEGNKFLIDAPPCIEGAIAENIEQQLKQDFWEELGCLQYSDDLLDFLFFQIEKMEELNDLNLLVNGLPKSKGQPKITLDKLILAYTMIELCKEIHKVSKEKAVIKLSFLLYERNLEQERKSKPPKMDALKKQHKWFREKQVKTYTDEEGIKKEKDGNIKQKIDQKIALIKQQKSNELKESKKLLDEIICAYLEGGSISNTSLGVSTFGVVPNMKYERIQFLS